MTTLVTFADSRLRHAKNRLRRQAKSFNYFSKIVAADETDLDSSFRHKFKDWLNRETPGYGYWSWKPQLILQVLSDTREGDCVVYVDAGCHLNKRGRARLEEYVAITKQSESGILGFENEFNGHISPESWWTKGSVFDFFEVGKGDPIVSSAQICGGIFVIQKRPEVVKFFEKWLDVFETRPDLVDDSESAWNFPDFIMHRHDQSIFSIMGKLTSIELISHSENFPAERDSRGLPDWTLLQDFPIQAKRDKATLIQSARTNLSLAFRRILTRRSNTATR